MILFKKLYRTLFRYKSQFISMILMIIIGVGVFLGFNGEWNSLKSNGEKFFEECNIADYWIYNETTSFSNKDLELVSGIEGVSNASRRLTVNTLTTIDNKSKTISLNVVDNYGISSNYISSGVEYEKNSDGIYLNDKFAASNNLSIGDQLSISFKNSVITAEIVSLIKNPEYMYAVEDENQVMPDFNSYGYAYITPQFFKKITGMEFYNQIIVKTDISKKEFINKINDAFNSTMLILSHDECAAIQMLKGEVEEGQIMGNLLPVVFLAIAILGMITTMHRITSNEKSQIGILKALGFKNKKILKHYASYGLFVGLIGCLIAIPLGIGVAALIVNPNFFEGTCFDFPTWNIVIPWWCYLVLIGIVILITVIAYISTKKILTGPTCETLKPNTPKKVRKLAIEKTKLWSKLAFSTKWNVRDLSRSKSRSFMALVGVIGCMILLIASFGMKDTMNSFMYNLNEQELNFDYKIILNKESSISDIQNLKNELNADSVSSTSIKVDENTYSLEIYDNKHEYIKVLDSNNEIVKLENDGVYICSRIAEQYGLKENDFISFSLFGSGYEYNLRINKIVKSSISEAIFINMDYANSVVNDENISLAEIVGISYLLTNEEVHLSDSDIINKVQLKKDVMDSYNSFMEIMNLMVVLFAVFAVLLGFVVLYNLGSISYVEKYRELSTLKVVGFRNKQIGSLLIKQNIWLTVVGILLGIPCGIGTLVYVIKKLATEYEMTATVSFISYIICIGLTLITSIIVNLIISKKNIHINMVESLKIAD